jgi:hypothetical protein
MEIEKIYTNSKIQDIEATINILQTKGKVSEILCKLSSPSMFFFDKETCIEILEFEKNQELEKIKFMNKIKK